MIGIGVLITAAVAKCPTTAVPPSPRDVTLNVVVVPDTDAKLAVIRSVPMTSGNDPEVGTGTTPVDVSIVMLPVPVPVFAEESFPYGAGKFVGGFVPRHARPGTKAGVPAVFAGL